MEVGKALQAPASGGGLQRKKSTLSRQVDQSPSGSAPNLDSVLEESLSKGDSEPKTTNFAEEDVPILPPAPPGHSLRRSTRTTYRKGSFRAGERVGPSRRLRPLDTGSEASPTSAEEPPILGLTRVSTDPTDGIPSHTRAAARARTLANDRGNFEPTFRKEKAEAKPEPVPDSQPKPKSSAQTNGQISQISPPITPAPAEQVSKPQTYIPERKSSQDPPPTQPPRGPLPPQPSSARASKRLGIVKTPSKDQSITDLASQPSPLPGSNTRTDALSVIPTFTEEKKPEPKKSKVKKDPEGSRKSSWPWRRDEGKKEDDSKKAKSKMAKPADKLHDDTRLDVLQSSIDGGSKRRESLTFDRSEIRLDDDTPRKHSYKKSSGGDSKKEKESGIFSFFGGGGRKKHGADKKHQRQPSPEPQPRLLRPDVDYNWTRFSILEERAIYRMAHIKLANPRRALYSQVLLTNFMYSYLAKVQQMHPQAPIAASPAQEKQQQQQKDQPDEYTQYQRYQQMQEQGQYDDSYGDYDRDDGGGTQTHGGYGGSHQQQYGGYPNDQFIDDDDDDDMW